MDGSDGMILQQINGIYTIEVNTFHGLSLPDSQPFVPLHLRRLGFLGLLQPPADLCLRNPFDFGDVLANFQCQGKESCLAGFGFI